MRWYIKGFQKDCPLTLSVGGLELTMDGMEEGEEVTILADERGITMKTSLSQTAPENQLLEEDSTSTPTEDLFQKLSILRKQLSVEQGLPPYVIFTDKSLREMVQKLPEDLTSFGSISGVGSAKLEKYGDLFLGTIRNHKIGMAG